jgi:homoaconitase/3-isopropylmalate dehydratase large subunit
MLSAARHAARKATIRTMETIVDYYPLGALATGSTVGVGIMVCSDSHDSFGTGIGALAAGVVSACVWPAVWMMSGAIFTTSVIKRFQHRYGRY